jgi:hypothetical protein
MSCSKGTACAGDSTMSSEFTCIHACSASRLTLLCMPFTVQAHAEQAAKKHGWPAFVTAVDLLMWWMCTGQLLSVH